MTYLEKRFDKKAEIISNFVTSQTGQQISIIHILPNMSRRKGNQTMKFSQLIEILFLRNHTQNVVEKLIPNPFIKNQN